MSHPDTHPWQPLRPYMGWMISHNPENLYETLDRPAVTSLADAVYTYARYAPRRPLSGQTGMEDKGLAILWAGVQDTARLTSLATEVGDTDLHSRFSERAPEITEIIASMALLPQRHVTDYFRELKCLSRSRQLQVSDLLLDPHTMLQITPDPARGCPFAKNRAPKKDRDPLFDKFVSWVIDLSEIALCSTTEAAKRA